MRKALALRAWLMQALAAHVASDPDRLDMVIPEGTAHSTLTPSVGWSWAYTVEINLIDYAGGPDEVMAAVILWARRWEPELFRPGAPGIGFDADIIDAFTCDLRIRLRLTEGVNVVARPAGDPPPSPGALPYVVAPVEPLPAPYVERPSWEAALPLDPPDPALLHQVLGAGLVLAQCAAHAPPDTDG